MLNKRFTFLCSDEERVLLTKLSQYLNRSKSDAIRFLLKAALSEMRKETNKNTSLVDEEPLRKIQGPLEFSKAETMFTKEKSSYE